MATLVERFEDMTPTGRLRLIQQEDGDLIVTVIQGDHESASVEFCMPMTGGGQSSSTHEALRKLMVAMAKDEIERQQSRQFEDGKLVRTAGTLEESEQILANDKRVEELHREFGGASPAESE